MIRVLLPALLALGCASTPYAFAPHGETDLTLELREGEPQIERGVPNAWVDGFGHYFFSLPSKLILLNWKVDNHDISDEVEQSLEQYLHANGLCNTKVRLNQYAPGGEWQRLFRNQEMPAGWRYTFGIISVSLYTIFPERLLAGFPFIGGGDHYNPYTNTVSIYSGSRPIVIHEGGHAKDFAGKENRQWKGAYAGLRGIPLLGIPFTLWQEARRQQRRAELGSGHGREPRVEVRLSHALPGLRDLPRRHRAADRVLRRGRPDHLRDPVRHRGGRARRRSDARLVRGAAGRGHRARRDRRSRRRYDPDRQPRRPATRAVQVPDRRVGGAPSERFGAGSG